MVNDSTVTIMAQSYVVYQEQTFFFKSQGVSSITSAKRQATPAMVSNKH